MTRTIVFVMIFEFEVFWIVWDVSLTLNVNSIEIYAMIIISENLYDITQDLIDHVYKFRNVSLVISDQWIFRS